MHKPHLSKTGRPGDKPACGAQLGVVSVPASKYLALAARCARCERSAVAQKILALATR